MNEVIDVSLMQKNPDLGQDLEVAVLVKWTNQTYHDENLKSMFTGEWDKNEDVSRRNAGRHRQQYYEGMIGSFNLSAEFLDTSNAEKAIKEIQPTDIDIDESSVALAAGNRIFIREGLDGANDVAISNPWFARLHSIERIGDGKLLTVSSAFDQIYILDEEGNIVKNIDVWEQGKNVSKFGHTMLKASELVGHGSVRINPSIEDLKTENQDAHRINVINDPQVYKGLGLPTYLTPSFVNHVSYDKDLEMILATTLNTGEGWLIDPETGKLEVVVNDLVRPHGLIKYMDGYMVTDSGREEIRILDDGFIRQKTYSLAGFTDRKPGLEKSMWLQNTTQLTDEILVTISAPRQKVTLINTVDNEYRDIPFDKDWGIQVIKPMAIQTA